MEWQQERRTSVSMPRRASAVAQAREQAMVAKARIPVVPNSAGLLSVTKKGVKSLEIALGALSTPFVGPVVTSRRSSPSKPKSHRKRSSQMKDVEERERDSVASDITLPSTFELEEIITTAEEVVVNARRKQSILLGIIINFQMYCRVYLAKAPYDGLKGAPKKTSKPRLQKSESYAIRKRAAAATRVQRWFCAQRDRQTFARTRRAAIQVQALVRARRTRFAFDLLMGSIARIQARFRGYYTREHLSFVLTERMKLYRQHIFLLWQRASTPLCYRTKFWPLMKEHGFLRVSITEAELLSFWKELKIEPPVFSEHDTDIEGNKALFLGKQLGLCIQTHWKCLKVGMKASQFVTRNIVIHSFSCFCRSMLTFHRKRYWSHKQPVFLRVVDTKRVHYSPLLPSA